MPQHILCVSESPWPFLKDFPGSEHTVLGQGLTDKWQTQCSFVSLNAEAPEKQRLGDHDHTNLFNSLSISMEKETDLVLA